MFSERFFVESLLHYKTTTNMFWKILIVCAFIGMMKPIFSWLWDSINEPISWLLSFVIPGLIVGVLLSGVMIIGEFMCICSDIYIFGYHSFLVGMVIGSGLHILSCLITWFRSR